MAPRDSAVGVVMCKITCWVGAKPSKFFNIVTREVVQIIDEYDKSVLHLTTTDIEIYTHVCRCMLEAALFPGITD